MMDFLFGADMPLAVRFFFAFVIVLALIGLTAFLVRRFGGERLGASSSRGRQPRLAVIDAAAVDGRRRLILIRRDNVEHLLMIGGPSDVVVEANIVRAGAPAREGAGPRPPEALPRAVTNEGNMWPLQPEPASAPPPARAPRQQPMMEDPPPWHSEPEAPPLPPRRAEARPEPRMDMRPEPRDMRPEPMRPEPMRAEPRAEVRPEPRPAAVDPLAGLAAELSRTQPEAPAPKPRPIREREAPAPREREPMRTRAPQPERVRPAPPPAEETTAANADQNLAEMAQRLEAALRRPKAPEPRASEPAAPKSNMMAAPAEPMIPMLAHPAPMPSASEPSTRDDAPAAPQPQRAAAGKPGKSVYDSLEQEMASLLGRPNSKA
jgi:flagellar protein FliO/FliZ